MSTLGIENDVSYDGSSTEDGDEEFDPLGSGGGQGTDVFPRSGDKIVESDNIIAIDSESGSTGDQGDSSLNVDGSSSYTSFPIPDFLDTDPETRVEAIQGTIAVPDRDALGLPQDSEPGWPVDVTERAETSHQDPQVSTNDWLDWTEQNYEANHNVFHHPAYEFIEYYEEYEEFLNGGGSPNGRY